MLFHMGRDHEASYDDFTPLRPPNRLKINPRASPIVASDRSSGISITFGVCRGTVLKHARRMHSDVPVFRNWEGGIHRLTRAWYVVQPGQISQCRGWQYITMSHARASECGGVVLELYRKPQTQPLWLCICDNDFSTSAFLLNVYLPYI